MLWMYGHYEYQCVESTSTSDSVNRGQILTSKVDPPVKGLKVNSFKPEFTIVIFIHYKPQIAVAILDF